MVAAKALGFFFFKRSNTGITVSRGRAAWRQSHHRSTRITCGKGSDHSGRSRSRSARSPPSLSTIRSGPRAHRERDRRRGLRGPQHPRVQQHEEAHERDREGQQRPSVPLLQGELGRVAGRKKFGGYMVGWLSRLVVADNHDPPPLHPSLPATPPLARRAPTPLSTSA